MVGEVLEIVNPVSRERIVIRDRVVGAAPLRWELYLEPGGRVPSSHAHPRQRESFTVLAGSMRFTVGGRRRTVSAGEQITVEPGTVHAFANPGGDTAHVLVETFPALDMVALLEAAAALAGEQQAIARPYPRLVDLALFMREFDQEVRAPALPALVRVAMRAFAALARWTGRDRRYRRLRSR